MGEFSRLTGVFFEPTKAFADIAERPRWIAPMILVILAGLAFAFAVSSRIGWDTVARQQIEQRAATASQQQREAMEKSMDLSVKITKFAAFGGVIVFPAIMYLIVAGILLGIVNGLMSAGLRFKQMFAIQCYASLTGVVGAILGIVVIFLKAPADFNIQNPVGFNPGAYMDPQTTGKFVQSLATSLDLFTIWTIILVAIGIKAAAGKKVTSGGALMAVALPWVAWSLLKATLAGLF